MKGLVRYMNDGTIERTCLQSSSDDRGPITLRKKRQFRIEGQIGYNVQNQNSLNLLVGVRHVYGRLYV